MFQISNNADIFRVVSMGKGNTFCQITNSDNKTWILPLRNTKTAMGLYQPSHWKGKLFKCFLSAPFLLNFLINVCNVTTFRCELRKELYLLFSKILKTNGFEFSIFCGTPSVHQKLTIQLSRNDIILGYCKASSQPVIADLFLKEQDTLNFLHSVGIEDIPNCLYNGFLSDGTYIFVQSTKKKRESKYVHSWGRIHDVFLKNLYDKTRRTILFEETEYFQHLDYLNKHLDYFSEKSIKGCVQSAIKQQMRQKGNLVQYVTCHADFTPWNMFMEENRLFVFDWEYAIRTCPEGLDYFHFYTQTRIFEKHYNINQIWNEYINNSRRNDEKYLSYLLLIVSIYIERNILSGSIEKESCLRIWTGLIVKLTPKE